MTIINDIEREYMKSEVPEGVRVGDSVAVGLRIREGEKERVQTFHGTVIAQRGAGIQTRMTVRRIVAGEGVELTVPVHSPRVAGVQVERRGMVRRAKLYYLRDRVGKATRIKEDLKAGSEDRRRAAEARAAAKQKAAVANEAAEEQADA
mgnify:CR=1 FL=1